MSSVAKNILLIVEGESDEVRFFKRLFGECFKSSEYHFYPYKANVHVLAQELFNHYPSFEDDEIDLQLILASLEKDKDKKALLTSKYTDVYMIFDFDPQHDHPHFDTVRRMLLYFNDSTLHGKMYINYPMMQSYKHYAKLPDNSFYTKMADIDEIHDYKQIVGNVSGYTDLSRYNYVLFYSIAIHHLIKINYMLTNNNFIPTYEEYLALDLTKIYDIQVDLFSESSKVFVLNTCILALSDYSPQRFLSFIKSHKHELLL